MQLGVHKLACQGHNMAGQKYNKAYEAYQQAVYQDGHNPAFHPTNCKP